MTEQKLPMQYMDKNLPRRMASALIFAIIFMAAGKAIPDAYFKYIDDKEYYAIVQPIPVDKKFYKPCEEVFITATRTSLLNTDLHATIELVLRTDNDTIFKVPEGTFMRSSITEIVEKKTILTSYPLPCNLKDGIYFWQILVKYELYGNKKTYLAVTDTFNVNETGIESAPTKSPLGEFSSTPTPTGSLTRIPTRVPTKAIIFQPTKSTAQPTKTQEMEVEDHTTMMMDCCSHEPNPTPEQNDSPIKKLLDKVKDLF